MSTDAVGGVWQYSLDLARGLSAASPCMTLATLGPGVTPERRAEAGAVPGLALVETGLPLDWLAETVDAVHEAGEALAKLADEVSADLVHLHSPALVPGVAWPCPVVAVHHSCVATWWSAVRGTALPDDFVWRTELTGQGLAAVDAVIAPTAAFAGMVAETYGLSALPHVVANGRPAPVLYREGHPAASVFTAGRLWDEGKGIAVLDRAAARLSVPVEAAGSPAGPNGAGIALVHVTALGSLDETAMREKLAARPIYAAPAFYEPFGLAVLEAAQAGCALVLADIPTFRELWADAAFYVPTGDDRALGEAIAALLASPARREALGRAAAARAACYTVEAMVAGTRAVHAAVLGSRATDVGAAA